MNGNASDRMSTSTAPAVDARSETKEVRAQAPIADPQPLGGEVPDYLRCPQSFSAALIATLPAAPIVATLFSAACHLTSKGWQEVARAWRPGLIREDPYDASLGLLVFLSALVIFFVVWIFLAVCYRVLGFTAANRANASSYGALVGALRTAHSTIAELHGNPPIGQPPDVPQSALQRIALR